MLYFCIVAFPFAIAKFGGIRDGNDYINIYTSPSFYSQEKGGVVAKSNLCAN